MVFYGQSPLNELSWEYNHRKKIFKGRTSDDILWRENQQTGSFRGKGLKGLIEREGLTRLSRGRRPSTGLL